MNNDILTTLNKILSDEDNTKLLSGIITSLNKGNSSDESQVKTNDSNQNTDNIISNTKATEIQKKIDVLFAIMPLFEDNKKVKIEKIINALKVIKMMLTLT